MMSIGIMILLTFSTPLSTPKSTTKAVRPINRMNQRIGSIGLPMKDSKYPSFPDFQKRVFS